MTTPALAATTLIVPPTSVPNSNVLGGFNDMARSRYVEPYYPDFDSRCNTSAENCIGVNYPATFWPVSGGLQGDTWNVSVAHGVENLNDLLLLELATSTDPINLFGYSQGTRVVGLSVQNLVTTLPPSFKDRLSVSLAGNTNRPNGGVWARFTNLPSIPILNVTFGDPTPTDTFSDCTDAPATCRVTDVSFEYDGVSDFPLYLFNVAAVVNALAGIVYPHTTYLGPAYGGLPDGYSSQEMAAQMDPLQHPENFAYYGDTRYITIPSPQLPIVHLILEATPAALMPIVAPILELIEPVLQLEVDNGYDRTINPGQPTPFRLFRIPFVDYDPLQEFNEFVAAVQEGVRNATDGVPYGSSAERAVVANASSGGSARSEPARSKVNESARAARAGSKRPVASAGSSGGGSSHRQPARREQPRQARPAAHH